MATEIRFHTIVRAQEEKSAVMNDRQGGKPLHDYLVDQILAGVIKAYAYDCFSEFFTPEKVSVHFVGI